MNEKTSDIALPKYDMSILKCLSDKLQKKKCYAHDGGEDS